MYPGPAKAATIAVALRQQAKLGAALTLPNR